MSEIESSTLSFRAKDQKYYASYKEMVQANILCNEAFLVQKGLDHASMQRLKKSVRRKTTSNGMSTPETSRKRPAAAVTDDRPPRRSTRLKTTPRTVTRRNIVSSDDNDPSDSYVDNDSDVENFDIDDDIDTIAQVLEQQEREQEREQVKKQKKARRTKALLKLSPADRQKLQQLPEWVDSMGAYLLTEEHLSIPNQRSVMRQVEKLALGLGVEYARWGGHIFMKGEKVDLSMDFDHLLENAKDHEDMHGKDLGNGWAIRHPIKKLGNFQRYCLE
jgi:hypothetical protein